MTVMSAEDDRTRLLHAALIPYLVRDRDGLVRRAEERLRKRRAGDIDISVREWEAILRGGVEGIIAAFVDPSPRAIELRRSSPFSGMLPPREEIRIKRVCRERSGLRSSGARSARVRPR